MNIICGKCGKDSGIEESGSVGRDAALLERLDGWGARFPALVGIFEWYFACSADCMKQQLERAYKANDITPELGTEAQQEPDQRRGKIPEMAEEICEAMPHGRIV